MGLVSDGGVHSHIKHLIALIDMAKEQGVKKLNVHAFLDGRDTPPQSAKAPLQSADAVFKELGIGKTASVIGRYYAMDRDARWDRVEAAYNLIAHGKGNKTVSSATEALEASYQRNENDEFMQATVIGEAVPLEAGDAVFFMNFRADRARELSRPFVEPDFTEFDKGEAQQLPYLLQDHVHI